MDKILQPYLDCFVDVYLDNIVVYSLDLASHIDHLCKVLSLLRKHKLHAKLSKCLFAATHMEYLGHVVSAQGVVPDPSKLTTSCDWPTLTCAHDVQVFLGMTGYYACFVKLYATVAAPLSDLMSGTHPWVWGKRESSAFWALKAALVAALIL